MIRLLDNIRERSLLIFLPFVDDFSQIIIRIQQTMIIQINNLSKIFMGSLPFSKGSIMKIWRYPTAGFRDLFYFLKTTFSFLFIFGKHVASFFSKRSVVKIQCHPIIDFIDFPYLSEICNRIVHIMINRNMSRSHFCFHIFSSFESWLYRIIFNERFIIKMGRDPTAYFNHFFFFFLSEIGNRVGYRKIRIYGYVYRSIYI